MFLAPADNSLDPKLEQLLAKVEREVFGPVEDIHQLDFATIEPRSHEVGQRTARRLAQQGAARQAHTANLPQLSPLRPILSTSRPGTSHADPGRIDHTARNRPLLLAVSPSVLLPTECANTSTIAGIAPLSSPE